MSLAKYTSHLILYFFTEVHGSLLLYSWWCASNDDELNVPYIELRSSWSLLLGRVLALSAKLFTL